jgi:hypothetical protein
LLSGSREREEGTSFQEVLQPWHKRELLPVVATVLLLQDLVHMTTLDSEIVPKWADRIPPYEVLPMLHLRCHSDCCYPCRGWNDMSWTGKNQDGKALAATVRIPHQCSHSLQPHHCRNIALLLQCSQRTMLRLLVPQGKEWDPLQLRGFLQHLLFERGSMVLVVVALMAVPHQHRRLQRLQKQSLRLGHTSSMMQTAETATLQCPAPLLLQAPLLVLKPCGFAHQPRQCLSATLQRNQVQQ